MLRELSIAADIPCLVESAHVFCSGTLQRLHELAEC